MPQEVSGQGLRFLPFLSHLRVLEVGTTVAAARAGMVLRQLGAHVTKAIHAAPARAGSCEAILAYTAPFDRGKEIVRDGSFRDAMGSTDIVICDLRGDLEGFVDNSSIAGYLQAVAAMNTRAWVTISPFGLSGPYADYRTSDFVAAALGGLLDLSRCAVDGEPAIASGFPAELASAHFAALAALHAQGDVARTGIPAHYEVSMQESVAATGPYISCGLLLNQPGVAQESEPRPNPGPVGVFPCRDGEVMIAIAEDRQWASLVRAIGTPGWASAIKSGEDRLREGEMIRFKVTEWTRRQGKEEATAHLQSYGVASSPVNTAEEALTSPTFVARGFLEHVADDRQPLPFPARVTRVPSGTGRGESGNSPATRVLEVSHYAAGPVGGSWAGAAGCDVVKLEHESHIDPTRKGGPFLGGIADINKSTTFLIFNHSKSSAAVPLVNAGDRPELRSAVSTATVLIENVGQWRSESLGLTFDALRAANPSIVLVSSSGYGHESPMASYRAYGRNLSAYSGLLSATKCAQGHPVDIKPPWADFITAALLATVALAAGCRTDTDAWWIDVSMAELVAASLGAAVPGEHESAGTSAPPTEEQVDGRRRTYKTTGGTLAVSLNGPDEVAMQVLSGRTTDEAFHLLQQAGIAAGPVLTASQMLRDPHLEERGFFTSVDSPAAGVCRLVGVPWRRAGEGPIAVGPPPAFGGL
jgi:crotonobetainyl-CoA:carnitine CoA-transferase CaiB-like acyl-CoA transferase